MLLIYILLYSVLSKYVVTCIRYTERCNTTLESAYANITNSAIRQQLELLILDNDLLMKLWMKKFY